MAGWAVQYLGADTPSRDFLSQVDAWHPDLVGLSVSLVQQLTVLRETVDALRVEFGAQSPTIMVGGIPTNQMEDVWRYLGADLWSPDAEAAVSEVQ